MVEEDEHAALLFNNTATESIKLLLEEWQPNPLLTEREAVMDLVLCVTRTSGRTLADGTVACVLVERSHDDDDDKSDDKSDLKRRIRAVTTNTSFYTPNGSDVHAEIMALGRMNQTAATTTTAGMVAYTTIPPCKRCLAALVAAGITNFVSLYPPRTICDEVKERYKLSFATVANVAETRKRVDEWMASYQIITIGRAL